jgi:hypothetical protein
MSELVPKAENRRNTKRVAEIGAAGLGVAGISTAAYLLWRKRRTEAKTFTEVFHTTALIFEDPRLAEEQRLLLARLATRIHVATTYSSSNTITHKELCRGLNIKQRSEVKQMLKRMLPQDNSEHAIQEAYIGKRNGSVDGIKGYYEEQRLTQLFESGDCDVLNQAFSQLTSGIALEQPGTDDI